MRKILILGALLLFLIGALLVAANNLNSYLAENREWLAEQASSAVGRSVAFEEIGISFRGGLGARVTSVAIGEDPTFGKEDFLRADRIDAVIKILPALRGRYEVARVEIDAPEIYVIKTRDGFNFDSLGRAADDRAAADKQEAPTGALPLFVSSLRIRDGRLQYTDRSAPPASELNIDDLDFTASDVGLDRPIQLDLAAVVLGAVQQNIRIEGTLGPAGSLETIASAPVDLRVDVGPLVVDRLKKLALIGESIPSDLSSTDPIALNAKLSGSLDALHAIVSLNASDAAISYADQFAKPRGVRLAVNADLKVTDDAIDVSSLDLHLADAHLTGSGRILLAPGVPVDFELSGDDLPLDGWGRLFPAAAAVESAGALDLKVGAKGPVNEGRIPRIDATFQSEDGNLGGIDYQKLDGQASFRNQKVTLERLTLTAFEGNIAGAGSYDMAKPDAQALAVRGTLDDIDIGALLDNLGAGGTLQMAGHLNANFDLGGRGSDWEMIRQALTGNGAFEVANGALEGVNIAESALGGITGIPGLSNLISPSVRNKYPELFGLGDTVFDELTGKLTLVDGQALLEEIALAARDYRLDGNGAIGLDKAVNIGMNFVASQNLTGDLIGSVKEIKYLTDANGRFNLPLRLAGSMPSIRVQPDLQYVAQQLSSSLLDTGISKGLDALLGKQRTPTPSTQIGDTQAAEQPTAQPDPTEQLIQRGLGALLGGDR
jgi:uncharacterized protein involved in outer membrane biogenesis